MAVFEVSLTRKTSANAAQNARKRIEYVTAPNPAEAKRIALAMTNNAAFVVASIREAAR